MSKIFVTVVLNPFLPKIKENRIIEELPYKRQTLGELFCEFFPIPDPNIKIVASVNGCVYENPDMRQFVLPNDSVVFVPIPQGGGGGGSNPMMIIASIVVAAIAWYAAPMIVGGLFGQAFLATSAGTFITGLVSAGIMMGGGMLISSLFPQPKIDTPSAGSFESSPTYGWGLFGNQTQEGTMLPILIGERRVTPPIIASHVESSGNDSYMHILLAVNEGQVESIYGIEVNDQPVSYFDYVDIEKRYGSDTQEPIDFFNKIYSDKQIGAKLDKTEFTDRETSGNAIDGVQLHISAPMGLWYANDTGEVENRSAELSIQYVNTLGSDWSVYDGEAENPRNYPHYTSGRVYDPNEIAYFNGVYYKCTSYHVYTTDGSYYARHLPTFGSSIFGGSGFVSVGDTPAPPNGSCWAPINLAPSDPISLTINGDGTNAISKSFNVTFPEPGQYRIKIKVVSGPPEGNSRYGAKISWDGITEIINHQLTYPGVSLLALKIKASEQLSGGMPRVSCVARKVKHVFELAGERDLTNPANAEYFLLTENISGAGIAESKTFRSEFDEWENFCNVKCLTTNLYIDQRDTFNSLKNYFCEMGRAQLVQRGLKFGVVLDKEDVVTQTFNVSNMIKDSYKVNYLAYDDRANCIRVRYFDKDSNWTSSVVELRDNSFNNANKEIVQDITLFACDRKDLAIRHATLLLNYNKLLIRTSQFDAALDSLACTVGDVISVQHDTNRFEYGCRVESCSRKTLKLDGNFKFEFGKIYNIQIRRSDSDYIQHNTFTVPATDFYDTVTVERLFADLPEKEDVINIGVGEFGTRLYRIIAISRSSEHVRKITALEYIPEVYDDGRWFYEMNDLVAKPTIVNPQNGHIFVISDDRRLATPVEIFPGVFTPKFPSVVKTGVVWQISTDQYFKNLVYGSEFFDLSSESAIIDVPEFMFSGNVFDYAVCDNVEDLFVCEVNNSDLNVGRIITQDYCTMIVNEDGTYEYNAVEKYNQLSTGDTFESVFVIAIDNGSMISQFEMTFNIIKTVNYDVGQLFVNGSPIYSEGQLLKLVPETFALGTFSTISGDTAYMTSIDVHSDKIVGLIKQESWSGSSYGIACFDDNLNMQWAKKVESIIPGTIYVYSSVFDSLGNIYVIGRYSSTKTVVLKIDQNGELLWTSIIENATSTYKTEILIDEDDNLFAIQHFYYSNYKVSFYKINITNGEVLVKTQDVNPNGMSLATIHHRIGGGLFCCSSYNIDAHGGTVACVHEFDSSLSLIKVKSISTASRALAILDTDLSYYTYCTAYISGEFYVIVTKIDKDWNVIWSNKAIGGPGSSPDVKLTAINVIDGKVVINAPDAYGGSYSCVYVIDDVTGIFDSVHKLSNHISTQTMEFGNRALIAGSTCSMASILKIDPFIQKGSWRIDVGEDGDYIECNNETENIDNYVSAANVIIGTISTSISALSFASSLSTDIVFEDISESMIVTIGEKYGI